MSGFRIHPNTIEEVKQRVDIVDVVGDRVVLKKAGKDLAGLCPFHDDKSPSFTVSPSKGFYHCFACGAGGNAIKFLMELDKRSFSDVVLDLARRYQVPIETVEPEKRQEIQRQVTEREQLYEILALTARFFQHALRQAIGARALDYLREQRGLTEATIEAFQLGYAPAGWDTLLGYLTEQKRYPIDQVEKAGLVVPRKSGGGYYDRFRDRLMVPIADAQGRIIGFGGRTLGADEPKYLNSPETELFDKGRTLFGLDKAKTAIAKQDGAIVVEGYFDVIALHAVGITNVVAALGTALSLAQVKQLSRYTDAKRIILNFDADRAGQTATERAIGEVAALAYRGEVQLRVLNLPGGKDADEFLKVYRADDYRVLIDRAPLWLDWQIERAIAPRNLNQADDFQAAVRDLVQLLGQLPNPALRSHYVRHCAERLGQQDAHYTLQLERDLRTQVRGQRWHGRGSKWQRPTDTTLREAAEAQLLRIYVHCPDQRRILQALFEEREIEFAMSNHRLLWRHILTIQDEQAGQDWATIDLAQEVRSRPDFSQAEFAELNRILHLDELGLADIARPELVARSAIASLEAITCQKRCRHLQVSWIEQWLNYVLAEQDLLAALDGEPPSQAGNVIDLGQRRQAKITGLGGGVAGSLALAPEPEPEPIDLAALEAALDRSHHTLTYYQDLYYQERRYLDQLNQQRFTTFSDLASHPVLDLTAILGQPPPP